MTCDFASGGGGGGGSCVSAKPKGAAHLLESKDELVYSCCVMSVPLPSGLWERPFAAAAAFGFMTYVLNLVGVVSAMCLAKISPQKEAFFSAVSAGLILASATGGLISGAVTTADSEGIRGALPLASGLLAALLTMMAFERLLVHLQKKNSAVISWMIASPVARDDEAVQILEMEHDASAADERDSAPMRPARAHGAAAHSSSSLHEVIDQNLAASNDGSRDGRPTEAKLRAAMMLVLAMTVHHIPESMALGVAVYGVSDGSIQQGQCIVLAAVLALQNIPEGAACTSSLRMLGMKNSWRLVFISQLAGQSRGAVQLPPFSLLRMHACCFLKFGTCRCR